MSKETDALLDIYSKLPPETVNWLKQNCTVAGVSLYNEEDNQTYSTHNDMYVISVSVGGVESGMMIVPDLYMRYDARMTVDPDCGLTSKIFETMGFKNNDEYIKAYPGEYFVDSKTHNTKHPNGIAHVGLRNTTNDKYVDIVFVDRMKTDNIESTINQMNYTANHCDTLSLIVYPSVSEIECALGKSVKVTNDLWWCIDWWERMTEEMKKPKQ